jgi:hypothetical protein
VGMGIKGIHIVLISVSIITIAFFGYWTLNHNYTAAAYSSFLIAAALVVYGIMFIQKAKALK